MTDTVLAIAATEFRPFCAGATDVVDRIRKAMEGSLSTHDHALDYTDDMLFRGAIGAAMLDSTPEERERIVRSVEAHRAVAAMLSGVPIDLPAVLAKAGDDAIPLGRMWAAARKAAA